MMLSREQGDGEGKVCRAGKEFHPAHTHTLSPSLHREGRLPAEGRVR